MPKQAQTSSTDSAAPPDHHKLHRALVIGTVTLLVVLLAWTTRHHSAAAQGSDKNHRDGGPLPVAASLSRTQTVPIWVNVLGTVTPYNYVNVMPRIAGLLQSVNYREGQMVKAGQLLAQIDPRPFQIAVEQAQAQLLRDQAQFDGAKRNLTRYRTLLAQDSITGQQVDDQQALVAQYTATVAADRAALDASKLQLGYTRITAPVSGLAGLRPVDAGNMVNTNGAIGAGTQSANSSTGTGGNTGGGNDTPIVTLAQVQPVNVSFAIAQQQIGAVLQRLRAGETLPVEAWNASNTARLASGKLLAADNQISSTTGTLNLKAVFANSSLALYPNQFVNVRLRVDTLSNAIVVPAAAVAVGAPGTYVYVIGADSKVAVRPITTGVSDEGLTVVAAGLKAGEQVVTDGLDRLHAGATVRIVTPQTRDKTKAGPRGTDPGKAR